MLDTEPTGADGDETRGADTSNDPSATSSRPGRRRATSAEAPAAGEAGETPGPRRRTRKATTPPAEVETSTGGPAAGPPDAGTPGPAEAEPAAPARRTRSRRAAGAPETTPDAGTDTAGASTDTDAPAAPARRRRSRAGATPTDSTDQLPAIDPGTTGDGSATGAAPGVTDSSVTATSPAGGPGQPETGAPAAAGGTTTPTRTRRRATAPETSPPAAPPVMFVAPLAPPFEAPVPTVADPPEGQGARRRRRGPTDQGPGATVDTADGPPTRRRRRGPADRDETTAAQDAPAPAAETAGEADARVGEESPPRRRRSRTTAPAAEPADEQPVDDAAADDEADDTDESGERRRRRRGRRGRGRSRSNGEAEAGDGEETAEDADETEDAEAGTDEETTDEAGEGGERSSRRRRRRRRRGGGGGDSEDPHDDDPSDTVVHVRETGRSERVDRDRSDRGGDDEVRGVRGSTRLEAKRQRRREGRDTGRRRPPILTESEFLARREAVDRVMVVRERGDRTQIAVIEDDILVEHYVTKASTTSYAGNVYLGRVQNVLPSMEAAFVDIGKGRNAVLYAGEVDWDVAGLEGKARSIEQALKSGDSVVVQVTKDPIGHKGARLTSQVSLPGRYLVYVPNGSMTGISRKLPDTERGRLKDILRKIVPEDAGVIIRTAAEGASEEELTRDVQRLQAQWEAIQRKAGQTKNAPALLYAEPDLELRVVRDVFNEDFSQLVVSGDEAWDTIQPYVERVAPDLLPRLRRWTEEVDVFHGMRIDEQLLKALDRKVWLPSGGSLVIDRTEAMTVIDVNTGKFTGQGGNLEQTVTRNNLEAAEEVVRQLRLRDIGGIIVIDFIDMVLESNRELVLRRLTECLGRDRTKHQVAEVTSLGLVQMTRKRVGQGLLEAFSEPCPTCGGRGLIVHTEPVDDSRRRGTGPAPAVEAEPSGSGRGRRGRRSAAAEAVLAAPPTPALLAAATVDDAVAAAGADPDLPTAAEVDVASEDHRPADEALDAVQDVEPEADVAVVAGAAVVRGREAGTPGQRPDGGAGLTEAGRASEPRRPAPLTVWINPVARGVAPGDGSAEPAGVGSNGQAPRRRRRAASRPAGPPQPAHSTD